MVELYILNIVIRLVESMKRIIAYEVSGLQWDLKEFHTVRAIRGAKAITHFDPWSFFLIKINNHDCKCRHNIQEVAVGDKATAGEEAKETKKWVFFELLELLNYLKQQMKIHLFDY